MLLDLRWLKSQQHQKPRIMPIGTVYVGIVYRRPVFPVGLVLRYAVIPLNQRNGGQFTQPNLHGLAKEILQLGIIGRRLSHLINNRIVLGLDQRQKRSACVPVGCTKRL